MPAYAILDFTIHNPEGFEAYREVGPATVAAFNGKFIVRGGQMLSLEGNWNPQRLVVIEFPSFEQAKAWWESPAYVQARALRDKAAHTTLLIVDGYTEQA